MKFSVIAELFNSLENVTGRLEKTEKLAYGLSQMTPLQAQIVTYLSLGDLGPSYDNIQFQIAEKGLLEIIASLSEQSLEEITELYKNSGDLGDVVVQAWKGIDAFLSIEQVYDELVTIARISGHGSTELKLQKLVALLQGVDVISAKYIIRIVSKTLRLGFSDMTLIDAFSWMSAGDKSLRNIFEHAYNICADLGLVIFKFKQDGILAVESMQSQVGIPIRPAAAERLNGSAEVIEKLGTCCAQPKLDGFRLQIHLDKRGKSPVVKFYSRNLIDMSEMFPDIAASIMNLPVDNLICEGEAIGYQSETDTFLQFQETVKRKRKHNIEQASQDIPLRVYLFDILYYNHESMLNKTHAQRRLTLQTIFSTIHIHDLFIIDEQLVHTASELESYFFQSIGAGLEGLVIKKPDAVYQPGKRNFNWIKLKRKTGQKLGDTIDVVVLGYYVGQGRRATLGIGAFLVGIYNDEKKIFESVAKVGTGMTDIEFADLKYRCDQMISQKKPENFDVPKNLIPDVWVYPFLVCEIRADDITQSPVHTAGKTENSLGFALRFPRFVRYRSDKLIYQATTAQELVRLYRLQYL